VDQFLDVLERSVWTFIQAAVATFISDDVLGSVDLTLAEKAELAAIAGGVAVVKCLLALLPNPSAEAADKNPSTGVSYQYE
jgi:hypothetical protein